jgi:pimeloyl-ACP methyl ester carboxylesterase
MRRTSIIVSGIHLEIAEGGDGPPLLMLHGGEGFDARQPINAILSKHRRLICPSHPGFGKSALPDWLDSIDDVAHVYLDLLDQLNLPTVELAGCSVGGWIAAEMVTKAPERFIKLLLVGPVGVKTGSPDQLDVPDVFALSDLELNRRLFYDPAKMAMDPTSMTDDELAIAVRNKETLALLTWEPYMHNPKLNHRLHRVRCPTMFMRGDCDGLVSDQYMQKYAALIPKARTAVIKDAGHAPHLERPEAFAEAALQFLNTNS